MSEEKLVQLPIHNVPASLRDRVKIMAIKKRVKQSDLLLGYVIEKLEEDETKY